MGFIINPFMVAAAAGPTTTKIQVRLAEFDEDDDCACTATGDTQIWEDDPLEFGGGLDPDIGDWISGMNSFCAQVTTLNVTGSVDDYTDGAFDSCSDCNDSTGQCTGGGGIFCFVGGTTICMSDNTEKNIEHIIIGDLILSYNESTKEIEEDTVLEIASPKHSRMITIKFESGIENTNTFDHPYMAKNGSKYAMGDEGWSSYEPDETIAKYGLDTRQLRVGDICYRNEDGDLVEDRIVSITEDIEEVQTYTLNSLTKNNSYFANKILVNNEYRERSK